MTTIDVHAHYLAPSQLAAFEAEALRPTQFAAVSRQLSGLASVLTPSDRLEAMDAGGVDVQVLSMLPPGASFGPLNERLSLARRMNEEQIAFARQHPQRFVTLLSLPLPDIEGSLRVIDDLAPDALVRGVAVASDVVDWTLDEPRFEEIYARLVELDLPLILHPAIHEPGLAGCDRWRLASSIAPPLSTTIAAMHLVLSGMLDRVEGLNVLLPHLGGTLPFLAERIFEQNGRGDAAEDLSHYLRNRFYYDSCSYHPPGLQCTVDTAGVDRILLGSDYPFRGAPAVAVEDIERAPLPEAEKQLILGGTALRWFDPAGARAT